MQPQAAVRSERGITIDPFFSIVIRQGRQIWNVLVDVLDVLKLYPSVCEAVTRSRPPTARAGAQEPAAALVHAVLFLFVEIEDLFRREGAARPIASFYLAL
jgi:hypothetical protein